MRQYTEGAWTATGGIGLYDKCGVGTKVVRVFDGKEKEVTVPLALVYNSQTGCGADDAALMAEAKAMLALLSQVEEGPSPWKEIREMLKRLG